MGCYLPEEPNMGCNCRKKPLPKGKIPVSNNKKVGRAVQTGRIPVPLRVGTKTKK
jgi:hypothetical protein